MQYAVHNKNGVSKRNETECLLMKESDLLSFFHRQSDSMAYERPE